MKPKGFLSVLYFKFKQYGLYKFIKFSILELYRIFLRVIHYSYSEYKEDRIISKYLNKKNAISYIDVGSNHPVKFSNTYLFYLKGGKGIHVEPNSSFFRFIKN